MAEKNVLLDHGGIDGRYPNYGAVLALVAGFIIIHTS